VCVRERERESTPVRPTHDSKGEERLVLWTHNLESEGVGGTIHLEKEGRKRSYLSAPKRLAGQHTPSDTASYWREEEIHVHTPLKGMWTGFSSSNGAPVALCVRECTLPPHCGMSSNTTCAFSNCTAGTSVGVSAASQVCKVCGKM
jgi:hypothetical protein